MNKVPGITEILSWARPYKSFEVDMFCELFLDQIPGMDVDLEGNRVLVVGEPSPRVLWSCHTDTVHAKGGRQNVVWTSPSIIALHPSQAKPGMCLGADDGAGMWILLHMIAAGVPGLYIFHAGEEVGGIGSSYIAKERRHLLENIALAVAFDRKGKGDLIYSQMVGDTGSPQFARAFSDLLNDAMPGFAYAPCDMGSFTDTANYADIVPECVNVSVGYDREHGPRETLDFSHLSRLKTAMLKIGAQVALLPTTRTPGDYGDWGRYSAPLKRSPFPTVFGSPRQQMAQVSMLAWGNDLHLLDIDPSDDVGIAPEILEIVELLDAHPYAVAELLLAYGIDAEEIRMEVTHRH
jgi:hypothetical protein